MLYFGRYSFNNDSIDYIELLGNGDYHIHLARWQNMEKDRAPVLITGTDADSLREYLDREKDRKKIKDELEVIGNQVHRNNLQYQLKHPDI